MRKEILLAVAVAGIALLVSPVAAQNSVDASAQATTGDNVTIDSIEIASKGWVAIYEESVGGGPNLDNPLGSSRLIEGSNPGITVNTEGLEESGFYVAVLHSEGNGDDSFSVTEDPAITNNGSRVQDTFFVAVGTSDLHETYAEAKQQRRDLQNRIETLKEEINSLEQQAENTENASDEIDQEIQNLRDKVNSLESTLNRLDSTIEETETQLKEMDSGSSDSSGDGGSDSDSGGGTTNETQNDSTGGGDDSGSGSGGEGLPGFTAAAALVAVLAGAVLIGRPE